MEITNPAYLYLLIRNDLQSLNAGKAVAHGAHAANQFMHVMERALNPNITLERGYPFEAYREWLGESGDQEHGAIGFGTTIALSVNFSQLSTVVTLGMRLGFETGLAWDPSYPYETTAEVAKLIQHPEKYPPVYRGDKAVCFRTEVAAGYIFGRKDDLRPLLQNFPLMP